MSATPRPLYFDGMVGLDVSDGLAHITLAALSRVGRDAANHLTPEASIHLVTSLAGVARIHETLRRTLDDFVAQGLVTRGDPGPMGTRQ
jgi:hypothetical protein